MKISKIACVALLGASFAISSVFAEDPTPQQKYDSAVSAKKDAIKANKTNQEKKAEAYNKVMAQVKILQGISKLKEWDGTDGTSISGDDAKKEAFKKISDAVKAINTVLTDTNNIPSGGITLTTADKKSTLTINAGDVKVNIDGNGGNQVSTDGEKTLNFADPTKNAAGHPDATTNAADIAKIFDGKNANVWNEFINAFADEHAKLVAKRDEALATDLKAKDNDIQTAAVALATAETAATTYEGTVKNYDALNNALKNDVAAKEKDLTEKQADFAKKTDALKTATTKASEIKLKEDVVAQKSAIDALSDSPADKKAEIKKVIQAGVKVVKDGVELRETDVDSLADADTLFDNTVKATIATAKENIASIKTAKDQADEAKGKVTTAETDLGKAKDDLKAFQDKASDKTGVAKLAKDELASYRTNIDPTKNGYAKNKATAQAAKAEKEKELAATVEANKDKVALKGTDATSIAKQADAVTTAKTELTTAATGNDDAKKAALKKAIEAGVPVKTTGNKKVELSDVAGLKDADLTAALASAAANTASAESALNNIKTKAEAVKTEDDAIKTATEEMAKQKAKVKEISNTRAKAIATSENLNKGESDVLTALSDVFDSNARVEAIIGGEDADDIAEGVNELHSTLDTATKSLNKGNFTDIVIFNTNLATNTRLAKLSNPYNGNLALAYAVKNMAGEKFADNGSDALSSVVKEYTNRYNYDNNLWGNVFGGKAKVKDAANTDVYGFTLGYDKAFDNTIVGGFFTLAKAQSDGNNVKNDADNYSFGVYTRSYFGQNELDSKFAYGFAKNTLKTKSSLIGDNEGKYDSKYFDIALDYGYVFDIGNAKFVKPIFGLEYTNLKNDSFTAGGPVDLNFAKTSVKTLNAKLGAEFRAYTEKGDYFYVTPGIERELSKSADDSVLNFAGSRNVTFGADKKKYTYATLKTGAEFKITDSLSTNINFGVKARSKNQFYNGTLGLSYKF